MKKDNTYRNFIIIFIAVIVFVGIPSGIILYLQYPSLIKKSQANHVDKEGKIDNISCINGNKKEIKLKNSNTTVTFSCLQNNIEFPYNVYKLPDEELLLEVSIDKDFNNYKAKILDIEANKLKPIQGKILQEGRFWYQYNDQMPEDKLFIEDNILFNYNNYKFYKIPKEMIHHLYSFYNERNRLFKDVNIITSYQDGNELMMGNLNKENGSKKLKNLNKYMTNFDACTNHYVTSLYHDKYSHIWMENIRLLKRYEIGKLEIPTYDSIIPLKRDKDIIFFVNDRIYSYDPLTGNVVLIKKLSAKFHCPRLFQHNKDLILVDYPDKIGILNYKTGKLDTYPFSIPENKNLRNKDYFETVAYLASGYIFLYDFSTRFSLLFDLNEKRLYRVKNLELVDKDSKDRSYPEAYLLDKEESKAFQISDTKILLTGGGLSYEIDSNKYYYQQYNSIVLFEIEGFKR